MKLKLVDNWKNGYKWFSSWAFVVIIFLATTPLPSEVVALFPITVQDKLTALVAVCGFILRFVRQQDSLPKRSALPSAGQNSNKDGFGDESG